MVSAAAASALSLALSRSPLAVPALQLRSLSNPNVADGGGDREEAAGGQCR